MKAFHNDPKIKAKYVKRVKHHLEMDNLVPGLGWNNGKGCAIGCTLENYDHASYEKELGVPELLARVEDTIFEGLPKKSAMLWPERFLKAIKPGANLEKVKKPFLIFILEQNLVYLDSLKFDVEKFPDVQKVILTGQADIEQINDFKNHYGLDALFTKPWDFVDIKNMILPLLDK